MSRNALFGYEPVGSSLAHRSGGHAREANILEDSIADDPRRLTVRGLCVANYGRFSGLGTLNVTYVGRTKIGIKMADFYRKFAIY